MSIDIPAIEARANAATEGPWEALPWEAEAGGGDWNLWGPKAPNHSMDSSLQGDFGFEADAQFVAHARTDIPALISEVRRLEAVRDGLVKALGFYARVAAHNGPNQRNVGSDPYTPPDAAYVQDITRDGGSIARAALTSAREG